MKRKFFIFAAMLLVVFTTVLIRSESVIHSQSQDLPKSTLAFKGKMGFVVTSINENSPLIQAGLKPGDIIWGLDEQVRSIEQFQEKIQKSEPGTSFDVTYYRFNPTTGKLDEYNTTVKTIPFNDSVKAVSKKISFTNTENRSTQNCPSGCCERCNANYCETKTYFTGRANCVIGRGKCFTDYRA